MSDESDESMHGSSSSASETSDDGKHEGRRGQPRNLMELQAQSLIFEKHLQVRELNPANGGPPFVIFPKKIDAKKPMVLVVGSVESTLTFMGKVAYVSCEEYDVVAIPGVETERGAMTYFHLYGGRQKWDILVQLDKPWIAEDEQSILPFQGILVSRATNRRVSQDIMVPLREAESKARKVFVIFPVRERHDVSDLSKVPTLSTTLSALHVHKMDGLPANVWSCTNIETIEFVGGHLGEFRELSSLRSLNVYSATLVQLGHMENLVNLTLHSVSIDALPDNIGSFKHLRTIDLRRLNNLRALPESFANLHELEELCLSEVYLHSLPPNFGELRSLQKLELLSLHLLRSLPTSFGSLRNLSELELFDVDLTTLPDSFGSLSQLRSLSMRNMASLDSLPISFGSLPTLQNLQFEVILMELMPEDIEGLTSLQKIEISSIQGCEGVCEAFVSLPNLETLELSDSPLDEYEWGYEALPGPNLTRLPGTFGQIQALKTLVIVDAVDLKSLPDNFESLEHLESLTLMDVGIQKLPESFGMLSCLELLHLEDMQYLDSLPSSFGMLPKLKRLCLAAVPKLDHLPSTFGQLTNLELLDTKHKGYSDTQLLLSRNKSLLQELTMSIGCFQYTVSKSGVLQQFFSLSLAKERLHGKLLTVLWPLIIDGSEKLFCDRGATKISDRWSLDFLDDSDGNGSSDDASSDGPSTRHALAQPPPPKKKTKYEDKQQLLPCVSCHKPTQIFWLLREFASSIFGE